MHTVVMGPAGPEKEESASAVSGATWSWLDLQAGESYDPAELPSRSSDLIRSASLVTLIPSAVREGEDLLCVLHTVDEQGRLMQLGLVTNERGVVTVHSAFAKELHPEELARETSAVRDDLTSGRLKAAGPTELMALLVDRLTSSLEERLLTVAGRTGALDRQIRDEDRFDSEARLEELFAVRRDLTTVHNRLRQNALTLRAADELTDGALTSCVRRLDRLVQVCEGERDFLQGVLEYYEQRVSVKMNFAMERLAVVTVIVLPVTAISGILGMNTITTDQTRGLLTLILLLLMGGMVGFILHWTKKKDWW